jgi:hypothetical protein
MKKITSFLVAAALMSAGTAMAADSLVGNWNTVDEKTGEVRSNVAVYEQGGKIFAKITGLTEQAEDLHRV